LRLANRHLAITFSARTGFLLGLENRKTGAAYLRGPACPLFGLGFYDEKREWPKPVLPGLAALRAVRRTALPQGERLDLDFELRQARVTTTIELGEDELLRLRIFLVNRSSRPLVQVIFPRLSGLRVSPQPRHDVLVRPCCYGERIRHPARRAAGLLRQSDLSYPGAASMQWVDLYSKRGGLYLASYDQSLRSGHLATRPEGRTVGLEISKFPYLLPGQSWQSEEYVIGLHQGDWHWAADHYRAWADSWLPRAQPPAWVRDLEGWYSLWTKLPTCPVTRKSELSWKTPEAPTRTELPQAFVRFRDLPRVFSEARRLGLRALWVMSAQLFQFCDNFYHPDPLLGSPEELRRANHQIHRRRGRVLYYVDSLTLNPDWRRRLRQLYGDLSVFTQGEIPDWRKFRTSRRLTMNRSDLEGWAAKIMCAAAPAWQDYLRYWCTKYVRDYGADGMMVDEVGTSYFNDLCFNFAHGHQDVAVYGRGAQNLLRRIGEAMARANPDSCLMIEGCADLFRPYVHLNQISGVIRCWASEDDFFPELYRYTFPDEIFVDGFVNLHCMPDYMKGLPLERVQRWLGEIFLLGHRFDWTRNYFPYSPGDPISEYFKKLLRLVKATKRAIYHATFRDDVGLAPLPAGVKAKLFLRPRGFAVTLLDSRKQPRPFVLRLTAPPGHLPPRAVTYHCLEGAARLRSARNRSGLEIRINRPASGPSALIARL
jgi:hypothetical protein